MIQVAPLTLPPFLSTHGQIKVTGVERKKMPNVFLDTITGTLNEHLVAEPLATVTGPEHLPDPS